VVVVGVNTVIADDPELTTRFVMGEPHHAVRVILDSNLRIPLASKVLKAGMPAQTIVACCESASPEARQHLERTGATVMTLPARSERVDVKALVDELSRRGYSRVLVEGGATVHAAFLEAELVDEVEAMIAPILIGGRDAPSAVGGDGIQHLADAARLTDVEVRRLGSDILVSGRVLASAGEGSKPRIP
jgi:diaminohydroxyphosphoribosylaminopyrimidine deaminase/5-amino-6-(5-phosphoribosylamino)uracil reductase